MKQHDYDMISYVLNINLYTLNKTNQYTQVYGFNPKKKSHQWFLQQAIMFSNLYDKPLRMDNKFSTRFVQWIKHHRQCKWIGYCELNETDKDIDEILAFMLPAVQEMTKDETFTFDRMIEGITE